MRIFLAVELEEEVRAAVASLSTRLGLLPTLARAKPRWTAPSQLHVTLRFFGEVPAGEVERLAGAFTVRWDHEPFLFRLGAAGVFPARGAPRVVWLGVLEGLDPLKRLHGEVLQRARACGYATEENVFRPHVTVGRFRRRPGVKAQTVQGELDTSRFELPSSRVDRIVLYESRLTSNGATYRRICVGRLG